MTTEDIEKATKNAASKIRAALIKRERFVAEAKSGKFASWYAYPEWSEAKRLKLIASGNVKAVKFRGIQYVKVAVSSPFIAELTEIAASFGMSPDFIAEDSYGDRCQYFSFKA